MQLNQQTKTKKTGFKLLIFLPTLITSSLPTTVYKLIGCQFKSTISYKHNINIIYITQILEAWMLTKKKKTNPLTFFVWRQRICLNTHILLDHV